MDKLYKFIFCALFTLSAVVATAQEQPEKRPEQVAATEVEHWETLLELTPTQTFYVDSILNHNYKCMFDDIERMRGMGMQSPDTYRAVQGKCLSPLSTTVSQSDRSLVLYILNWASPISSARFGSI